MKCISPSSPLPSLPFADSLRRIPASEGRLLADGPDIRSLNPSPWPDHLSVVAFDLPHTSSRLKTGFGVACK